MKTKISIFSSLLIAGIFSAATAQTTINTNNSIFSKTAASEKNHEVRLSSLPLPAKLFIWWVRFRDRSDIMKLPML